MTAKVKKTDAGKLNILVAEEHRDSLQTILEKIQGKAYANVLSVTSLLNFVKDAEALLADAEIANSYRAGATFKVTPNGPSSLSYGYAQLGTSVAFERKKSGWVLTHIERMKVWPRQTGKERLSISLKQKAIVVSQMLKKFEISKDELRLTLSDPRL